MNLSDIRQECWDEARETATNDLDRLWTTSEMNRYINRVYRNIARETKCIRDSITPSICRITSSTPASLVELTARAKTDDFAAQDLAWYNSTDSWLYGHLVAPYSFPLSPLIITVDEVKWTDKQWRLVHVSLKKWQVNPWWEQVIGMATEYATDGDSKRIFVNFRTTDTDVLKLTVRRLPIVNLIDDEDIPEFKSDYHDFFKNGVLSIMYSKQDSQTFDATKVVDYKKMFLADLDEVKQSEEILDNRLRCSSSLDAFR
jgi:hypothetical protein